MRVQQELHPLNLGQSWHKTVAELKADCLVFNCSEARYACMLLPGASAAVLEKKVPALATLLSSIQQAQTLKAFDCGPLNCYSKPVRGADAHEASTHTT